MKKPISHPRGSPPRLSKELAEEAVSAMNRNNGHQTNGATELGICRSTFQARLKIARERFNLSPTEPMYVPLETHRVKGTSTLVDAETGVAKLQWIKTTEDQLHAQLAQEAALNVLCGKIPAYPKIIASKHIEPDLCTLYTMTDCHVGMLAWGRETGADWDLGIAERVLTNTLLRMIEAAPASELGILNQLGDFLHFDSLVPLTPTSKNALDADSRYQKIVECAVRILENVIAAMLKKHKTVQVYMMEGNHDPAGSVWLRTMFARLFRGNSRVTVGISPNPYVAYQHGATFLGFYHGHLAKKVSVPQIFAARFSEMWGKTAYRYVHLGHLHHVEEKEHPGIKVIQHPTLAAPDAYAARSGWLSMRQATSMTYSKKDGEVARGIFIPVD